MTNFAFVSLTPVERMGTGLGYGLNGQMRRRGAIC